MKPSFALSLSFEGIGLLHRAFPGWNRVGEVALDEPDLAGALAVLRDTAAQINGAQLTSKLVIPNDQIKYLSIETGVMDEDARRQAIRAALDGATPYAVDDLVYDWTVAGEQTQVAAVARETLSEAESFAVEHGFGPISFVATPEDGQFSGEPFFGPTRHAASLLAPGEEVQRDSAPIRVIGVARLPEVEDEAPDDPVEHPPKDAVEAAPKVDEAEAKPEVVEAEAKPEVVEAEAGVVEVVETETEAVLGDDEVKAIDAEAEAFEAVAEAIAKEFEADTMPEADPAPFAEVAPDPGANEASDPEVEAAAEAEAEPTAPAPAVPAFSTIRARRDDPAPAARMLSGARRGAEDLIAPTIPIPPAEDLAQPDTAPRIASGPDTGAEAEPGTGAETGAEALDDLPPMPAILTAAPEPEAFAAPPVPQDAAAPRESRLAFFSRRSAGLASGLATGIGSSLAQRSARRAEARAEAEAEAEAGALVVAGAAVGQLVPPVQSEKQRMTVFGARKPERADAAAVVGGKPRYLGLILTVALLLFLAGVAAWASIFVDEGLARFFGTRERAVVSLPAGTIDELAAEGEEAMVPEAADATTELAALDQGVADAAVRDALRAPVVSSGMTEAQAQARYAVTGIWQMAPRAPEVPGQDGLDELYVASIDARVAEQDAVALPPVEAAQTDDRLASLARPAARGTRFALDQRGLVVASAAGTLTPEGFMVFTGKPPKVPAAYPQRSETTPEASEALKRLAGVRPKARPGGLVEQNERDTLGGLTRTELARKRPKLRPEQAVQKVAEEADETATEQAVAASRKPNARPSNFARVVERARESEDNTAAVTQVAAVAPPTVAPKIPSNASVAKQATVRNAISLSKINLIGVYGKPSSRRALVRLSNGRYKKVQVGDRIDGGRISAIGDSELRYQKNGRDVILKMPKG